MSAEVVAYTSATCPHCHRLKAYLRSHNVPFRERDVATDEAAVAELEQMGATGVPVIRVGGEVLMGFSPDRLDEALRSHGAAAGA
ncbi:glutaredoxin family protein [Gemmata sp.]|uniref:glutaredoxin family protein n=1 Tax=Gemmata sp. TaxID=1914242 RepID=UPI003F6F33EA